MPRLPSCSQSPYSAPISRYLLPNRFCVCNFWFVCLFSFVVPKFRFLLFVSLEDGKSFSLPIRQCSHQRRPAHLRPEIRTVRCRSMSATASVSSVDSKPKPWLLVGLGNPGKKYEGTRHNVGFEMLDIIAEEEGISVSSIRFKALFGKGTISGVPVLLAKPQTFMNASGESVGSLVSYFNIPLNQVLLIYDDMDLPFATLRLLPKGGHGGHNGMRSVIDHFKRSRDFPRLRIGIGRPPGKMDPVNFVMRTFTRQEREELNLALQKGLEGVRILLLEGFNKSASFVNQATASNLLNS